MDLKIKIIFFQSLIRSCCLKQAETCWWPGSPAPTRQTSGSSNPAGGITAGGRLRHAGEPPGCNSTSGTGWLRQTVRTCAAHRHEDPGLQRQVNSAEPLPQVSLILNHGGDQTMEMGIKRAEDGMFPTFSIPHIADRISQGIRRLPKLLRTQVRLLCMHKSGKVVSNGPPAPPSFGQNLIFVVFVKFFGFQ